MLILLKNAQVFAPENIGIRHLLCGGGRVLSLSKDLPNTSAMLTIDCEGRRVVPGFIDSHAHITGGGGEAGFATRVPAPFLSHYTCAGVTTVVGVLGTDDTTRDTRSLVASAYALREEGLGAFCHTGGYHLPAVTLTGRVKDDIVFIDPVIGVGEVAISDHRSSQPTLDELLRLASEAHVAGLISGKAGILHLHLGDGERGLTLIRESLAVSELPPRVFNPTHINRQPALLEESIGLASLGSYVDATAFPVDEADDAIAADVAFVQYLDAGGDPGRFSISSDGGGCLPVFDDAGRMTHMDVGRPAELTLAFQQLLTQGVPLETALRPVTSTPADLLRLNGRGRIVEGGRADLLVLDDNHQISDVMVNGEWHLRDTRLCKRGRFETDTDNTQPV